MNERLVRSAHGKDKHQDETWNVNTIIAALTGAGGGALGAMLYVGKTADMILFAVGGAVVGLVVSKAVNGVRVAITGYKEKRPGYWKEQAEKDGDRE